MTHEFPATDWTQYDVPAIAAMLLADDYTDSWNQVFAWRYAHEAISEHQKQLRKAHAELAEAWPPEHSLAAWNYLDYVQAVDKAMVSTAEAAMTNATALGNVLNALTAAQALIHKLLQIWQAQVPSGAAKQSTSLRSPATAGTEWAATLNAQAHRAMSSLDQIVFENTRHMTNPGDVLATIGIEPVNPIPIPTSEVLQPSSNTSSIRAASHGPSSSTLATIRLGSAAPKDGVSTATSTATTANSADSIGPPLVSSAATAIGASAAARLAVGTLRSDLTGGAGSAAIIDSNAHSTSDAKPSVNRYDNSSTTTARRAPTTSDTANVEPGELLAPGLGPSPRGMTGGRTPRRRRGRAFTMPDVSTGVPGLLVPRKEEPIIHDPGPGVFGIDR